MRVTALGSLSLLALLASALAAPPDISPPPGKERQFWAFQSPRHHAAPAVKNNSWPLGDIDRFILAKLETSGLQPAPDADRHTLLRRVTFDLTGLPPTPHEIASFVNDPAPNAFEKVVDRLLASPAFGDRWGRHWLDLAQYADTVSIDRLFPDKNAWRYRDYVIKAFNDDKPFDQFIREQVAGDLLPATNDQQRAEQIVATAFLTHGPIQTINQFKEQLRWDIIDNQVHKVGVVFMGMSLGCARCHDHKFDPITQKEYYGLAGIFQNLQVLNGFSGMSKVFSDWVRVPLPETSEEKQQRERAHAEHARVKAKLESQLKEQQTKLADLEKKLKVAKVVRIAIGAPFTGAVERDLTVAQQKLAQITVVFDDHVKANAPESAAIFAAKENGKVANARITVKGNAYQLGDEVPRGFVRVASAGKAPAIPANVSGRLQLAQWLTDPHNPLTARVVVNRLWHHVFGAGLVRSVDNFGTRGEKPSHSELLDELSQRFIEQGWSVKQLIREMMLSRTYGMASDHNAAAHERDPDNRLLWRMHRRRLEAEAIRDAKLLVSGELDLGRGGPSLPPAAWMPGPVADFVMMRGEPPPPANVANRRTVYLPVYRRPAEWAEGLILFNCPLPSVLVGARMPTTVPTQSLYLLNSPFVIERSRKAAERLLARNQLSAGARVETFYLEALGRPAQKREIQRALDFIQQMSSKSAASKPATEAWALFCQSVFVSNEFLFRF